MEMSELPKAVLTFVMVGLILATGLLVLNKFDRATRDTGTVVSTGYNLTAAGTKDFSETYCLSVTTIANATTSFVPATYNMVYTDADGCAISYDAIAGCGPAPGAYCNITYTYGVDNSGAGATTVNVVSALSPIASSWLPLIITVLVLSIILVLVLQSFGVGKRE